MKFLLFITIFIFSNAYGAICDCNAPASCGDSRPPHCKIRSTQKEDKSNFFANRIVQIKAPKAFVLSGFSKNFVSLVKRKTMKEAHLFINKLKRNKDLYQKVMNYADLSLKEQMRVLKRVFNLEVSALKIKAPKLVLDTNYARAAYFDFNFKDSTNGIVYINPAKTYKDNKIVSLSLLLHETKHAAQLQLAKKRQFSLEGRHYRSAFLAQKKLQGSLGFSDFLTLNNEYEAFLYANYIIHKLFNGKHDMVDMGTFASQFRQNGDLKIDLTQLHKNHPRRVLEEFNILMLEQQDALRN